MPNYGVGGIASAIAIIVSCVSASAQEVTLESFDGTLSVTGDLLEVTEQNYKLQTVLGEILVRVDQVDCFGDACPVIEVRPDEFAISGSANMIGNLLPPLLEGFALKQNGNLVIEAVASGTKLAEVTSSDGQKTAEIELIAGGNTAGLNDLLENRASLAVSSRAIQRDEAGIKLSDLAASERETVLALDGLLLVTSKQNPVRAITEADAARIFSGAVSNWAEIGGHDAPINLYVRNKSSGTGVVFDGLVMGPAGAEVSAQARELATDAEVSNAVMRDQNGIGFTSFSNVGDAKPLAIRGVCGIQTPATAFTIKTEEYPLARRLYVYKSDTQLDQQAGAFLEYIRSEDAQTIIAQTGFVDQSVQEVGVNGQGLRFVSAILPTDAEATYEQIQEMVAELITGDRLSITYRFEQGSATLDARARGDIVRLASLLAEGDYGNKEILLLGFTDSVGKGDLNVDLSLARAQQVRDALVAAAPAGSLVDTPITAIGYGEMSPLGCNETPNGRFINRRVEVWTRDVIRSSQ